MARALHWQIPFRSLKDFECRVDIYDEDYTGSVVQLTGGTDTFYVQDADDDDMLSTSIRYRTGYINVVEPSYGDLDALQPTTATARYVEAYYKGSRFFRGYIKMEQANRQWDGYNTVLSFPVVSPLGLAEGLEFNMDDGQGQITLLDAVKWAMELAQYGSNTHIIYPQLYSSDGDAYNLEDLTLKKIALCPFGDDYFYDYYGTVQENNENIYAPNTVNFLITAICSVFQWTAYDTGLGILFVDKNYAASTYVDYDVDSAQYDSAINPSSIAIENYFEYADNSATISTVEPYRIIDESVEDDDLAQTFGLARCTNNGESVEVDSAYGDFYLTFLYPTVTEEISSDVRLSVTNSQSYDTDNRQFNAPGLFGLYLSAYSGDTEALVCNVTEAWDTSKSLVRFRCYDVQPNGFRFRTDIKELVTQRAGNPQISDVQTTPLYLLTEIKAVTSSGQKLYYHGNGVWNSTAYKFSNTIGHLGDDEDKDFIDYLFFVDPATPECEYIDVTIYVDSDNWDKVRRAIVFQNIEHSNSGYWSEPFNKYLTRENRHIRYTNNASKEGDVGLTLNTRIKNMNYVSGGEDITASDYTYASVPQEKLQAKFRRVVDWSRAFDPHFTNYSFAEKSWNVIAHTFHPWSDEDTLSLYHPLS